MRIKPLSEVIHELEEYYKDCELKYSLEERVQILLRHKMNMEYLLLMMHNYDTSVRFIVEHSFSCSMISRSTLNLIMTMAHIYNMVSNYSLVISNYLLDDQYDENFKHWDDYNDIATDIKTLILRLQENEFFAIEKIDKDIILDDIHIKNGFGGEVTPLVFFEKRIAYLNGAELLYCLQHMISLFERSLTDLKMAGLREDGIPLSELYDLNYLLYVKRYWPAQQNNFRSHIEHKILRDNVTIEKLERERVDEIRKFEADSIGQIWRDYSEDKANMALAMNRQKLTIRQWLDFFYSILKIEEYDRWIEELRNPPESEEDKQKRERLLKTNKVFTLQPAKSKYDVDILLLYFFIRDRFITEKMFVYEWYALYYILKRNGILLNCTTEDFVNQMNKKEWFVHVEKKCSANEINTYGFLTDKSPDVWDKTVIPKGNRASSKSIDNIYRKYSDLEENIDEIYIKG